MSTHSPHKGLEIHKRGSRELLLSFRVRHLTIGRFKNKIKLPHCIKNENGPLTNYDVVKAPLTIPPILVFNFYTLPISCTFWSGP